MYPTFPQSRACGFFLSPGSGRSGRVLLSRHILHNGVPVLQLPSKLVSGGSLFLVWFEFGWPARASNWAPDKFCWRARRSCSKLCKQALRQLT